METEIHFSQYSGLIEEKLANTMVVVSSDPQAYMEKRVRRLPIQ